MNEFHFHTKLDLTLLLGIKANNLRELLDGIKNVPDSSIYYHTHKFLQQHHYLSPEPPNDFAYWTSEVINDVLLAEKMSSIDIIQFHAINGIRGRLIEILESHTPSDRNSRECPQGQEFHFMASQMFILPTSYAARNISEFRDILEKVSINSLYFHIFDSRLRLERDENDFSVWFTSIGLQELADEVKKMDPYTYSMEGLRRRLAVMVRKHVKY